MNRNISDVIEQYLKRMMEEGNSGFVELQRSELAELFQCVPSQINYVISTRFTLEQGYVVESKRGGGGYIRIRQIQFGAHEPVFDLLRAIGDQASQREAEGLIDRLEREGLVTRREGAMLRAAVCREVLRLELPLRDILRAAILGQMLTALFSVEDLPED